MPWAGIVFFALIVVLALRTQQKDQEPDAKPDAVPTKPATIEAQKPPIQRQLPLLSRLRLWWLTRPGRARQAAGWEYSFESDPRLSVIDITFFGERRLLRLLIKVVSGGPLGVSAASYMHEREWIPLKHGVKYASSTADFTFHLSFPERILLSKIRLHLDNPPTEFRYMVHAAVAEQDYPDCVAFRRAMTLRAKGREQEAIETLLEYDSLAPKNPSAYLALARSYAELKHPEQAEFYALKAAANGMSAPGTDLYRCIQAEDPFLKLEELRTLQRECSSWQPGSHHGVLVLSERDDYRFGMDGWYVRKYHSILEIRREAAARFLTRFDIPFTSRDVLLYSNLRVVHADDSTEVLPQEKLSIGDSHTRNVFIEDTADKLGTWLLPDLAAGDIIEWSFHIAFHESLPIDGKPHVFVLTALASTNFPSYQATIEFRTPASWNLKCVTRNCQVESKCVELVDVHEVAHRFKAAKSIPLRGTGYRYEISLYNPMAACCAGASSWDELARAMRERTIGENQSEATLPEPLMGFLQESPDARACLEATFYWLRDKMKYGSFVAATQQIGNKGRLESIVKSGAGDCMDKSFVLAQMAERLSLPWQYVLVSTEHGVTIEELPSDQFDHIFIRILLDGGWQYFDTTDSLAVFGLPSNDLQGLKALALSNDGGSLITLPEDDPSRNKVDIIETFDCIEGNRLAGQFTITARGRSARLLDQHWKRLSLQVADQLATGSQALGEFLPRIELRDLLRRAHTGNSDVFEVTGHHRRCELGCLRDSLVGSIAWNHPAIPTEFWQVMIDSGVLSFQMPFRLDATCTIASDLVAALLDFTEGPSQSNCLCDITSEHRGNGGRLQIHRSLTVRTRLFDSRTLDVPLTMRSIGQALQVTLRLQKPVRSQ